MARTLLAASFLDGNIRPMLIDRCRAAAEAYVKAFLVANGIEFPDIADLLTLIRLADVGLLPSDVAALLEYEDVHRALAAVAKVKEYVIDA